MLQLESLSRRAKRLLPPHTQRGPDTTMDALEQAVDARVLQLREQRVRTAESAWERLCLQVDAWVQTDALETLDQPDHPAHKKLAQVRALHRQNQLLLVYQRYFSLLRRHLLAAAGRRTDGRARLLELGCGSGEFTLAVARIAARERLPVDVVGSDIEPTYVSDGNRRAKEQGIPARFRVLNAFDLSTLEKGEVDVAFIVHSMHHLRAGQLAKMIAQSRAAGATAFVGLDGYRSLSMLFALPVLGLISFDRYFVRDAFVSARRLHSHAELEIAATTAAPDARVTTRKWQGLTVLEVLFDGA